MEVIDSGPTRFGRVAISRANSFESRVYSRFWGDLIANFRSVIRSSSAIFEQPYLKRVQSNEWPAPRPGQLLNAVSNAALLMGGAERVRIRRDEADISAQPN